jgi:type 1 glutamine amidotransferase
MYRYTVILLCLACQPICQAGLKSFPVTPEWTARIAELAPAQATVKPKSPRRVLLFSLSPGYKHWCIPHTAALVETLAQKSQAFSIVRSDDVQMFASDSIKTFDAIVLNNTCSRGPGRNIFLDALGQDQTEAAQALETSLINYLNEGGGLVALHGSITFLNNSPDFSAVLGASFNYHPPQQEVHLSPVEPDHPLLAAFEGKPFVHVDEPYIFTRAYHNKDFRPLLRMDRDRVSFGKRQAPDEACYVSWIRRQGKGRVFYCSPSHNAQSYDNPALLRYIQDGIQYALGDLVCDDSRPTPAE